ncbi:ATP-grasp fold amidoligase family protein [Aestuariicoccus sp. MJ-SS9]|uniref:ATP-grasp fold amidoligase family protein n=1 Tax=Aestuariicoccus sp. MJ-SS9 TaxID=3079855 RepID=UPI002910C6ED|nr:ATP-grasp fold amidoligase family protein [Aestuariicoccus sp. MJ-SS9]MDU8914026.1 ATP-grasp fold amidoligase family protein [Aestuariicoccus sp. MJ-SS9]
MAEARFKQRMDARLARWYHGADPHPDPVLQSRRREIAQLVNKTAMRAYATRMKLPLPERYAEVSDIAWLDAAALPDRVVIKPDNAANAEGVMLFDGDRELLRGAPVPRAERRAFAARRLAKPLARAPGARILAEALIADYDPAYPIPRDFKVYVAGGAPHVIQMVDRNGPTRHRFYDRDWRPYDDFQTSNAAADPIPRPPHFAALMDLATRIAGDIGVFMRLDFYIAAEGVVFGEFTSYPNAGKNFTETGDAVLCALMDRFPDAV